MKKTAYVLKYVYVVQDIIIHRILWDYYLRLNYSNTDEQVYVLIPRNFLKQINCLFCFCYNVSTIVL